MTSSKKIVVVPTYAKKAKGGRTKLVCELYQPLYELQRKKKKPLN